jgi:hypothetical protein
MYMVIALPLHYKLTMTQPHGLVAGREQDLMVGMPQHTLHASLHCPALHLVNGF